MRRSSKRCARNPVECVTADRQALLDVLACCLMGNRHRLVLHTRPADLPLPMRHLNGVSTQAFNRWHRKAADQADPRARMAGARRASKLLARQAGGVGRR